MKPTASDSRSGSRRQAPCLLAAGMTVLLAGPVSADMTLDAERSSISMISVKVPAGGDSSVSERLGFSEVSGQVDNDGQATVSIPLDSINTGIDIRDERMREHLFETGEWPEATITASVPQSALSEGSHRIDLDTTLSLHGKEQQLSIPALVDVDSDTVVVNSMEPVLLDAADYELGGGIDKLTELAGLMLIPTTVPVSFTLTFTRNDD